jgi:hypothetical protein
MALLIEWAVKIEMLVRATISRETPPQALVRVRDVE